MTYFNSFFQDLNGVYRSGGTLSLKIIVKLKLALNRPCLIRSTNGPKESIDRISHKTQFIGYIFAKPNFDGKENVGRCFFLILTQVRLFDDSCRLIRLRGGRIVLSRLLLYKHLTHSGSVFLPFSGGQCQVAFFFRQWGGKNKKNAGREINGQTNGERAVNDID